MGLIGDQSGIPAISNIQDSSSKVAAESTTTSHKDPDMQFEPLHNKKFPGVTAYGVELHKSCLPQIHKSRLWGHFSFFTAPHPLMAVKRCIILKEQQRRQQPQWDEYA
ncbi:uncharacterized protein ARMOST_06245 [Armillaria ostoyae]|uniref:Uncharacterized protein n=1 Tax=Armillaria ostoyae TaxID=47428 RepID=A0A284R2E5_ARMOS|nr:uncharacterized protein ARMOST_06245 [Armillaria ostoyae]